MHMEDFNLNETIPWKVTFDGNFWDNKGYPGKEIPVKKTFTWGTEQWYIPAVYRCSKGLAVDFCMSVEPEILKSFIHKWNLLDKDSHHYSQEEMEQIQNEHPLDVDFTAAVTVNKKSLTLKHGCGISWIPESCLDEEFDSPQNLVEKYVLEHYELNPALGWAIHRCYFLWATKNPPVIKSLALHMKRRPTTVYGPRFTTPSTDNTITFTHPSTGAEHTLTIQKTEPQELKPEFFPDENKIYPTCFSAMTYTIEPDIPRTEYLLQDHQNGDRPRPKAPYLDEFLPKAASIAMIGGADGPTSVFLAGKDAAASPQHTAFSSLYFEPQEQIEWNMLFYVKSMEDIKINVI